MEALYTRQIQTRLQMLKLAFFPSFSAEFYMLASNFFNLLLVKFYLAETKESNPRCKIL